MTDLPHDAWVVVADGAKALLLRNEGDETYPNLILFDSIEQDNPPTREQGSDRPGRFADSGPGQTSAAEQTDWHDRAEAAFAAALAERLYKEAHKGKFATLILVCAPRFLGVIRAHLHDEVKSRLAAEIDKDLTKHPIDRIEKVLAKG
jgi:protein required for attachment to host cells